MVTAGLGSSNTDEATTSLHGRQSQFAWSVTEGHGSTETEDYGEESGGGALLNTLGQLMTESRTLRLERVFDEDKNRSDDDVERICSLECTLFDAAVLIPDGVPSLSYASDEAAAKRRSSREATLRKEGLCDADVI